MMKQAVSVLVLLAAVAQAERKEVTGDTIAEVDTKGGISSGGMIELVNYDTHNGMVLWPSVPKSHGLKFHSYLLNVPVTIPPHKYGPVRLTFKCSSKLAMPGESCTAFVFLYRCRGCYGAGGASFEMNLINGGWRRVPCGAYFVLDHTVPGAHEHRFSVYHIEVLRGGQVSVLAPEETEFFFWGKVYKTSTCTEQDNEASCNNFSADCMWDEDLCVPKDCPKYGNTLPYGPNPNECSVCVGDEAHLVDAQATPAPRSGP